MFANAKNGCLTLGTDAMDYVRFGTGKQVLVILPGLGDGLQTVKGTALPMAWMYRIFSGDFTVYMFSRKHPLPQGATTRDMARDLSAAMEELGISQADVLGVSMGGMIAQHLAIDYPEKVRKLILTVTCPGGNPVLKASVELWISQARQGNHRALMDSNMRLIYSEDYYRKNKWMIPLVGVITKPASYDRFLIQAEACLTHDTRADLHRIKVPTLVIGGEKDLALGPEASRELAAAIPGAVLKMYDQWGHGLYEEAKDFNQLVKEFLTK